MVLCRGDRIDRDDLLLSNLATAGDTAESPLQGKFLPCTLDDMERRHILMTLQHTNWNKSRAAVLLGIERSTLDRKIRRYGLAEQGPPRPPGADQITLD